MKSNVLPKQMAAHMCRGPNSLVVSLHMWWVVGGGAYVVGGGGGKGGVGVAGVVGMEVGVVGLQLAWNLTNLSMIQNNDVWLPETYTNDW